MSGDKEERIRARAHEIWEREGRPEGRAEEHWRQAAWEIEAESPETGQSGGQASKETITPNPEFQQGIEMGVHPAAAGAARPKKNREAHADKQQPRESGPERPSKTRQRQHIDRGA